MLKKIWHFIGMILGLTITMCMIYIIGLLFNVIPNNYMPSHLFPEKYNDFINYLHNDAESNSSTSSLSGALYDYIKNKDNVESQKQTEETKTNNESSPVSKAKEAVDNYNQSIQKEKENLDQY